MIIEYRLNLDQGKDQAQLKWPLPLTSARNRASDVHSSSLSSLWDSGSWFCLRFSESRRWLPHYLTTTIKSGLFSKTTCLSMIFWRGTHHHRSRVPSIRISVCAILTSQRWNLPIKLLYVKMWKRILNFLLRSEIWTNFLHVRDYVVDSACLNCCLLQLTVRKLRRFVFFKFKFLKFWNCAVLELKSADEQYIVRNINT